MTAPTFFVPSHGSWSGGGKGVLNNYRHAAGRHSELSFDGGEIDVVNRNYPNSRDGWRRPFVLAPQNAWPWEGPTLGAKEKAKVAALRVVSEVAMHRANGVIRVGRSIPVRGRSHPDLLPNPLDPDFDEQVRGVEDTPSPSSEPYLLSLGSINSYRGIEQLLEGYRRYLAGGGSLPLRVIGGGQPHYLALINELASDLPSVTISTQGVSRREALTYLHHATAAVLPSHVEASPFSLLEALAVQHNVIASDITGHHDIVPAGVPAPAWFRHADPTGLADLLAAADEVRGDCPAGLPATPLATSDFREQLRVDWGDRLVAMLREVSAGSSRG